MSSIHDQIRDADDLDSDIVDVPEWGVKIRVQDVSLDGRGRLVTRLSELQEADDPDWLSIHTANILIATCHDPETDEAIFGDTDDDRALLRAKNGGVTDRLAAVAIVRSGLSTEAVEEGKDDSSSTTNGGTGSSSPSDSG